LVFLVSTATAQKTDDDLEIIRKMSIRYGDDEIASVLNSFRGRRTGKGLSWGRIAVKSARRNYGIPGHSRTREDPGIFSMQAEPYLSVSNTTIERLASEGLLPMKRVVPFAPWEIRRSGSRFPGGAEASRPAQEDGPSVAQEGFAKATTSRALGITG
jgi:hypothetical protein